jgi:hypothetical protein
MRIHGFSNLSDALASEKNGTNCADFLNSTGYDICKTKRQPSRWNKTMTSWLECLCGNLIHTNLFTGTRIYKLLQDADYDAIEDPVDREKLSDLFLEKGITVYRCQQCGRLAVEWNKEGDPTFYLPEVKGTTVSEKK